MNRYFFLPLLIFISISTYAQTWTKEQLTSANSAKDIAYLTNVEKEAIMYINLARLYPKLFIQFELEKYFGPSKYDNYLKESSYRKSLITYLNSSKPLKALSFDSALYENAKCFAKELGDAGAKGHTRDKCKKENYAECCSYAMDTGKDIAMQWLIDHEVSDLGHRYICLSADYSKIGLSVHAHKEWETCAVAELTRDDL